MNPVALFIGRPVATTLLTIGLTLAGVDLAIALWSEIGGTQRTWTSVMGNVGSAAFIGVSGLTIAVTSVGVVINQKAISSGQKI